MFRDKKMKSDYRQSNHSVVELWDTPEYVEMRKFVSDIFTKSLDEELDEEKEVDKSKRCG